MWYRCHKRIAGADYEGGPKQKIGYVGFIVFFVLVFSFVFSFENRLTLNTTPCYTALYCIEPQYTTLYCIEPHHTTLSALSVICSTISLVYNLFYISCSRLTLPTQHHIFLYSIFPSSRYASHCIPLGRNQLGTYIPIYY